ncbi:MAG: hypothetical protein EZS28_014338 [Streblomastix strix]|uniref:Reverse transcriptase domain-containing protein n=1 Tax=Streblomastix strix TaxID=222440 RepID=A0A5J4W602_9EUKA|nr:MAG: hypothetical protein EZS28_014338 [Streblomastix strix]
MDPTGKRATKYELEGLDYHMQSTLGPEVNKKGAIERADDADFEFKEEICKLAIDGQKASAKAITSLAIGDFESATQWMLASHHYDRIIMGKAQQEREQTLVSDIFKGLLCPNVSVSEILCQTSKEKLKEQEQEYQNQLNEELKNGIIKETNSILVYNPTFIVPRKDGRLRKILDCRRINFFTKHVHFKMDGAERLRQILKQTNYATILGIKDAFHHIYVQPNFQKFLGFKFKNGSQTYLGPSFGWKLSPFMFSKTLAIAIRAIRAKWKIKILHYMDDTILIRHSKKTLKQTTQDVIRFLQTLGWHLSPNKYVLIPKMTIKYLG